ncbi:MAG: hypothetical protein AB1333_00465 [Patescibacteria group bacterium]
MKIRVNEKYTRLAIGIFTLLNRLGYNDENRTRGMSTERIFVRKLISKNDWAKKYPALREARKCDPYWLLFGIAKFGEKNAFHKTFSEDLKRFLKEPLVKRIQETLGRKNTKELKKIIPKLQNEYSKIEKMFRVSPNIKKIYVTLNPLDAYWRGYCPIVNKTMFITIGPGEKNKIIEVFRHELLHLFASHFNVSAKIDFSHKKNKSLEKLGYKGKKILNNEYAVRGLSLIYEKKIQKKNIDKKILSEEKTFPNIREVISLLEARI